MSDKNRKYYSFRYILFLAGWLCSQSLLGQFTPIVDSGPAIYATAYCDGTQIMIRWAPSQYDIWSSGIEQGYKVDRITTHINGVRSSFDDMTTSRVTLEANLKPLAESAWNQFPTENHFADVAQKILYEPDPADQSPGLVTLNDAIVHESTKTSRYSFGMFVAEQDFDVAKGLALGYMDMTANTGETYQYVVRLADTTRTDVSPAYINCGLSDITVLPVVTGLSSTGFEFMAEIEWDLESIRSSYGSFDIEKSSDNVNFTQINDMPFIYSSDAEEIPSSALFQDTLDMNGIPYYYRIIGRSSFGISGPPSESVEVIGVHPRLSLAIGFDEIEILSDSQAALAWSGLDPTWNSQLQGFNIYTSKDSKAGFQLVNTSGLISPTERAYLLTDLASYVYAKVEAVDLNGHAYPSPADLVQMPDEVPPAIPSDLVGEFINSSRVKLSWTANTDDDLHGYRVFVGNQRNTQFTQVTGVALNINEYYYDIDPKFMKDSLYVTILATDHHENNSEHTPILAIRRPDIIPPSQPAFYKATPTPEGIQLGWRFSSSDDVSRHDIERKPKGIPDGWENLLSIVPEDQDQYHENITPNDITATCYVDTTILERREYQYRVMAYDHDDNVSSSKILDVRPFDSGRRGSIEDLRVTILCEPLDPNNLPNQAAFDTTMVILRSYEDGDTISFPLLQNLVFYGVLEASEYNDLILQEDSDIYEFIVQRKVDYWREFIVAEVQIRWNYAETERIQDFQIFRSTAGSPMMLYETVRTEDIPDYVYQDMDVRSGRRYIYQVMARHTDGGFSSMSETLMVRIPIF